ncbi:MAG: hypothetical protein RIR48_3139, partial [Bacteroidota bacterium]
FYTIIRLTFVFTFLTSCQKDLKVIKSYYHWRSVYKNSIEIQDKLGEISVLYVKMFDIVWKNKAAQPISVINWQDKPHKKIIPVVYITNEVMQKIGINTIDTLANNIVNLVEKLTPIELELQIDCDWSDSSRENYFALLKAIRKLIKTNTLLSCTIRLHQLKFAKWTGVPPVGRGMLMLYNMAALGDYKTENSIFDPKVIDAYIHEVVSYGLPLDLALAKYQQCVVFRNRQFVTTLRNENFFDPTTQKMYFKHHKAWYFDCIKDTTIKNIHIAKGDQIRFEKVNDYDGRKFIKKVAAINNTDSLKVVYFDIHS